MFTVTVKEYDLGLSKVSRYFRRARVYLETVSGHFINIEASIIEIKSIVNIQTVDHKTLFYKQSYYFREWEFQRTLGNFALDQVLAKAVQSKEIRNHKYLLKDLAYLSSI